MIRDQVANLAWAIERRAHHLLLGVELSAARVNVLDPRAILERLGRRLSLLTTGSRDVPERQRTLRAAIEWSHEPRRRRGHAVRAPRRLRRRVHDRGCRGGLRRGLDTLASLVDKSLVRRDGDRFSMLGSIHEYARELLDASDEASTLGRAHFDWYLALVRRLAEETGGATTPDSVIRLTLERENLRLALRRAVELDGAVPALELAVELAEADFWRLPAPLGEGRIQLESALAAAPDVPPSLRARALYEAAALAVMQGDAPGVDALAQDLLAVARSDGDPMAAVRSLAMLTSLAAERGDEPTAVRLSEEAVTIGSETDDERALLNALNSKAVVELAFGRYRSARELFERCLDLARRVARRPHAVATATFNVGFACVLSDEHRDAELQLAESLRLSRELNDPDGIAYCFAAQAELRARQGAWPDAARLLAACRHLLDEMGSELESVERRVYEGTLVAVRARLGEPDVADGWDEGQTLADSELATVRAAG